MTTEQQTLFGRVPKRIEPESRPPIKVRAGSELDHRWTHEVRIGGKVHGMLDESKRIYQSGGELSNFVYWKLHLVSLDDRVWMQIKDKVDWIELIDHQRNECWRIAMAKASKELTTYQAGIGIRVGIPMNLWDVFTSDGTKRQIGEATE